MIAGANFGKFITARRRASGPTTGMSITDPGEPYDPNKARPAVLQPKTYPLPSLRKVWFKNKLVCDEGWSLSFSDSSWRIDRYDYYEGDRHLVLGGEGATGQMDIFLSPTLTWDNPPNLILDEQSRTRVLHNITAALQRAGFISVGSSHSVNPTPPVNRLLTFSDAHACCSMAEATSHWP